MDKYEYTVKSEKIKQLAGRGDYATAAKIASSIEWDRVQDVKSLMLAADVFENNNDLEEAKAILLNAYDLVPVGKGMLYRLTEICLKQGKIGEAENYYDAYSKAAPHDISRYILRYDIACARKESVERKISILEKLNEIEVNEELGYELAKLYHKVGRGRDCVRMCDQVILWFGEGEFVDMARALKSQYSGAVAEEVRRHEEVAENRRKRIETLEAEVANHSYLWEKPETENKTIGDMLDEEAGSESDPEYDGDEYTPDIRYEQEYSPEYTDANYEHEYDDMAETSIAPQDNVNDGAASDTREVINISEFINAGAEHAEGPQLETFSWMNTDSDEESGVGRAIWEQLKHAEREAQFKPDPQPAPRERIPEETDDFSKSIASALSEEVKAFGDEKEEAEAGYELAPEIDFVAADDATAEETIDREYKYENEAHEDSIRNQEEGSNDADVRFSQLETLECGVSIPAKRGYLAPRLAARIFSPKFFDERGLALPKDKLPNDLDDTRKLDLPWMYEEHTKKLDELKTIREAYELLEKGPAADNIPEVNIPDDDVLPEDQEYLDIKAIQEAADAKEQKDKAASKADMAEIYGVPEHNFIVILVEVSDEDKAISRAMEMIHDTHESLKTEMIQVAKVTGPKVNARGMDVCLGKLKGRDLIVLDAGELDTEPVLDLINEIEDPQEDNVVILVDTPEKLHALVADNPELARYGVYETESGQTSLPIFETIVSQPLPETNAHSEEDVSGAEEENLEAETQIESNQGATDETDGNEGLASHSEAEAVSEYEDEAALCDASESEETDGAEKVESDDEYADYVDDETIAEALAAGSKLYEELVNMSQILPDIHDAVVGNSSDEDIADESPADEAEAVASEEYTEFSDSDDDASIDKYVQEDEIAHESETDDIDSHVSLDDQMAMAFDDMEDGQEDSEYDELDEESFAEGFLDDSETDAEEEFTETFADEDPADDNSDEIPEGEDETDEITSDDDSDDYDDYGDLEYDLDYEDDYDDESMFTAVRDFAGYAEDYAESMDCIIEETALLEIQACAEYMLQDGEEITAEAARELVNKAVAQAEKTSLRNIFSKKYDKQGRLILKEQHFKLD